ncbi:hypothetical protein Syun_020921 [Stephania yunnanensis]|uniref:Uncharacterized protein n=1 Tax=Stephania yunnanensis TaxID=152371 RepID=A0AAP0IER3_9MAGN
MRKRLKKYLMLPWKCSSRGKFKTILKIRNKFENKFHKTRSTKWLVTHFPTEILMETNKGLFPARN